MPYQRYRQAYQRYRQDLEREGFQHDPAQERAVQYLQNIYDRL